MTTPPAGSSPLHPARGRNVTKNASANSPRCATACTRKPRRYARPRTGPAACGWPHGCPARTSPTSCSSPRTARRHPGAGLRRLARDRTAGQQAGKRNRDLVRRPQARTRHRVPHQDQEPDEPDPTWRDANRVGYVWDLTQTSGPAVTIRAADPPRQGTRRQACGTPCAGWPGGRASRSSASTAAPMTGARCGPPAASGSSPAWTGRRLPGRWRTSSATCSCTTPPGTRPAPPPPAAPGYARPKPTRWPSSSATGTASRPGTGLPTPPPGRAVTRAPTRNQPSWPPESASPQPPRGSPATSTPSARPGHQPGRSRPPRPGKAAEPRQHAAVSTADATEPAPARPDPETAARNARILADAQDFFTGQLPGSWARPTCARAASATRRYGSGESATTPRVDRAHRSPAGPRPRRRRDPGRRARPALLTRDAHRSLPGPGYAPRPR